MYFSVNVSYASLPLFGPTIISQLGIFTTVQSQGLTAPPYVLVFCTILITAWATDKVKIRGPFLTFYSLLAAIGFILLGTTTSPGARYVGIFLAVQVFCCVSLLLVSHALSHFPYQEQVHSSMIITDMDSKPALNRIKTRRLVHHSRADRPGRANPGN